MKQIKLGLTGPEVSAIGFGCKRIDPYDYYGNRESIIELYTKAVQWGITFFDLYPYESRGQILEPYRSQVILSTKFGSPYMPPELIYEALEETMSQSGTIDLLYLGKVGPNTPVEDIAEAVQYYVRQGKVKHFGLCESDEETIRRAHAVLPLAAVQYNYSIWKPKTDIFPILHELGIAYVPFILDEQTEKNPDLVTLFARIGTDKHFTPMQIGLAWLMSQHVTVVPIVGTLRPEIVDEFIGSLSVELSVSEQQEINKIVFPGYEPPYIR